MSQNEENLNCTIIFCKEYLYDTDSMVQAFDEVEIASGTKDKIECVIITQGFSNSKYLQKVVLCRYLENSVALLKSYDTTLPPNNTNDDLVRPMSSCTAKTISGYNSLNGKTIITIDLATISKEGMYGVLIYYKKIEENDRVDNISINNMTLCNEQFLKVKILT